MSWKCDMCGECCKHVDGVPSMRKFADSTGRCKYLTDDNRCSIYGHRPNVCNVAYVYEHYFKDRMSEDDFYELTRKSCEQLKKK